MISKTYKTLFVIVFSSLVISACTSSNAIYFGDANFYNQTKHIKKPIYIDTSRTELSVSGSYSNSVLMVSAKDDNISFAEASFNFAHSRKHLAAAYSLGGFKGNYKVANLEGYSGNKGFYGFALTLDHSLSLTNKKSNVYFRVPGIRITAFSEFGEYYNFTREIGGKILEDNQYVHASKSTIKNSISLYAEIYFPISNRYEFGLVASGGVSSDGVGFQSSNILFAWNKFVLNTQYTISKKTHCLTLQMGYKIFDSQSQKNRNRIYPHKI